jgi:hypothetical protein
MKGPKARKAKRATKLGARAERTMAKAKNIYNRGITNLADPSPMAQDKGQQQLFRSERVGTRAKNLKTKSDRLKKESDNYPMKSGGAVKKTVVKKLGGTVRKTATKAKKK